MTSAPIEVEDWTRESKSFSPSMTASLAAPPEVVLDALAAGLSGQGYRILDRTALGFRARHREVVGGVLGLVVGSDLNILDRTALGVAAVPSGTGTSLTVKVTGGGQHRSGRKRGRAGISAGLQRLQEQGVAVSTTPWERD